MLKHQAVVRKFLFACVAALLLPSISDAQTSGQRLTIDGLPFLSAKKAVVSKFGKPVKRFESKAECGYLSQEQGEHFYTLQYDGLTWTGNDKRGYLLEEISLDGTKKFKIMLDTHVLSPTSTQEQVLKMTGVKSANVLTDKQLPPELRVKARKLNHPISSIDWRSERNDDKWIFYFIGKKLIQISYWSPC